MYLTSFIHCDELFDLAERWLRGFPEPEDALRLTEILICDGYVIGEVLEDVTGFLLKSLHGGPFRQRRIETKGEIREALCCSPHPTTPRTLELFHLYTRNPDFFYREAPINGVMYLDENNRFLGLYRIKRPRRIAEKANRYVANWIFELVRTRAQEMAEKRAREIGIPVQMLITPEPEMIREFADAEDTIAQALSKRSINLDKEAMATNDVGGIKLILDDYGLRRLEEMLSQNPFMTVVGRKQYKGDFRAAKMILDFVWDRESICRRFVEREAWRKYAHRGIPEERLRKGLESLMRSPKPTLRLELILSNFPDMVESEIGKAIHEERIVAQRDNKKYTGYIPLNVEFLIEYLFEVGFSPQVRIGRLPVKLWGRYLPDTVISHIRNLYELPARELYYC